VVTITVCFGVEGIAKPVIWLVVWVVTMALTSSSSCFDKEDSETDEHPTAIPNKHKVTMCGTCILEILL
jgi:hypothetical protein